MNMRDKITFSCLQSAQSIYHIDTKSCTLKMLVISYLLLSLFYSLMASSAEKDFDFDAVLWIHFNDGKVRLGIAEFHT